MAGITEELETLEEKETKLTNNKVARFCYEERAYTEDDANGVDNYDFSKPQNIPNATASVLDVNPTVLDKGFRSQASSLPRMTINHFFGRVSYNLNKVIDIVKSFITLIKGAVGTANGIASLDENGRIPYSQLPESALEYKGNWNAETNEPPLSDGMEGATSGDFYIVSVAGAHDFGNGEITFLVNDRVIYNKENKWEKLAGGNVRSVNEKQPDNATGNITLYGTDIKFDENSNFNFVEAIKRQFASLLIGRKWTDVNIRKGRWYPPVYNNGVWHSVSIGNGVAYSLDGINWLDTDITEDSSWWNVVSYANGLWFVCGAQNVKYSTNGITWNDTNITSGTWRTVTYANGVYLLSSTRYDGLKYSTDGITWYDTNLTVDGEYEPVYTNGVWVTCTVLSGVKYSTDGITWNDTNILTGAWKKPVYANGLWHIASNSSTGGIKYSTDGITWHNTDITGGEYGNPYTTPVYADGVWVTLGHSGSGGKNGICYSTDGISWTVGFSTSVPPGSPDPAYANGIWVVCVNRDVVRYSMDGVTWIKSNLSEARITWAGNKPVYANGVWILGGSDSEERNRVKYSTDGINWYNTNIRVQAYNPIYANGVWVIGLSSFGMKYSSVDELLEEGWIK